jgi:hypothetical protein
VLAGATIRLILFAHGAIPLGGLSVYYGERKWLNVVLSEAKQLATFATRFLAALGMTPFDISRSR